MRYLSIVFFSALLAVRAQASLPGYSQAANPLDFNLSVDRIQSLCRAAQTRAEERLQAVAAVSEPAFHNTFVPFSDILSDLQDETSVPSFLAQVAADKAVREQALACDTAISKYAVDVFSREDLYKILKAAANRGELLSGEDARLMEKTLLDFRRSGLALPQIQREQLKGLRKRIVELSNEFSQRISESKDFAVFPEAQMKGVPPDMKKRTAQPDGSYKVTLDYPDYFPFMENAQDPEARRILETKFDSRGGQENKKRLADILRFRDEAAKLLGYKDHAEFVLDEQMAQDPQTVDKFLSSLREKLVVKAKPELKAFVELKKKEEGPRSDGVIHAWDWRYYRNQLLKTRYGVDEEKIKEYFPTDLVVGEMLKIYQEVLGLRFTDVTATQPASWDPSVKIFEVEDGRTGVYIGRFFMDLYPREGKFKHAGAFPLIEGRELPDGSYQKPVAAIVANFDKPAPERASLLPHAEVETLFHEFGHVMHQLLTRAKYQRFSGTSVARDFVEMPSQMFQNWVWKDEVLGRVSGFAQDRSKKIPREMIQKLIAAKNAASGLEYLRQDFFAAYDMALHTSSSAMDTTALYARLMKDITLIPMTDGTVPESSFGHLMGYDAGYYGYLWSEVYACDAFSRFEKEGLLSPQVGRELRKEILEKGSARDEARSLRAFLGREPNPEAFLKNIGLATAAPKKP